MSDYLRFSRSSYYAVVAALPLLIVYELLLMGAGMGRPQQVRNAGDVWLRMLLESLAVNPAHATLIMILVLVLAIPLLRRGDTPLRVGYLGAMGAEAFAYSLLLGEVIGWVLRLFFGALSTVAAVPPALDGVKLGLVTGSAALQHTALAAALQSYPALANPFGGSVMQGLALSLGAGLFEEFVFRVVLVGVLLAFLRVVFAGWLAGGLAVVTAAFLFSCAHYIGPYGDVFSLTSFLFRFVAGLMFTALYYWRGFAITAYAHALYDIRVILF